ncbi:PREDICTED: olfactory receptor 4Q3-like [Gekko japonicus]|uniref:Olfactory receptor 4Q3-like n=1 Tax=Gekko japonicus TaxID=146911 RepID=A0ABM1JMD2_GEKJA|nr:PREDICTED: olfactory receptor 4Q3-like [Gekko japonicus]
MNGSTVTEFIFLGISCSHSIRLLLFVPMLVCYTTIMSGNLLIVVTVTTEPRLHQSPMYFFLASLSIIDAALGCVATPKMMAVLVTCGRTISFGGCMAQFFFLHFFGGSEMLLLTLMAYDRYVAICQPLTYRVTMNRPRCVRLLVSCWVGGFIHSATQLVLILRLPFCGPNELDSFYCDVLFAHPEEDGRPRDLWQDRFIWGLHGPVLLPPLFGWFRDAASHTHGLPLTYRVAMNRPRCVRLLVSCWVGGFIHSATQLVLILRLPFCGPNELDSFYCDVPQLVRLACANAYVTELLMVANSGLLSLVSFLILLVSYGVIIATLKGHFKERGGKALSTCGSHLMVVSLIFVPCLFVYLIPFSSSRVDKMASIFYTVVTPALNPIIYTLRNHEMKEAMGRLRNKCIFSHSCVKSEQN